MYPKKKKHHPFAVVLAAISVAVVLGAAFLLLTDAELSLPVGAEKPVYEPVSFAGNIKTFTLSRAALDFAASEPSREAHMQALSSVLDFAVQNGYDAILYEPISSGEYFCRINGAVVPEYIKSCDKLFDKWDPMMYFCEQAAQRGLGVFAVYNESDRTAELVTAVETKYPISGSYVNSAQQEASVTVARYTEVDGGSFLAQPALSADYYSLEKLTLEQGFFGLCVGSYEQAGLNLSTLSLWSSIFNEISAAQPLAFVPVAELALSYPINTKADIYTKNCYLMGTSNPDMPLTINGTEVVRHGTSGAFGVLVELNNGANSFVLSQGERELAFTLTRKTAKGSTAAAKPDNTVQAKGGQIIEISKGIASALSDPDSDSAINGTFKKGSRATVVESVRTKRSGKLTWAYKLASGDYVLAYNTTVVTDGKKASFTAANAAKAEHGELITIQGEGTPAAYTKNENGILTITFLDTDIAEGFAVSGSEFVSATSIVKEENGAATINLQLTDKLLWGWDIRYENGKTLLFLKNAPQLSTEIGKPLLGVRVLLDAGHGDNDGGAMGVGGQLAPNEKHVNLAVAMQAKYYLEKLGATVLLTRNDDTLKTQDERLYAQSEQAPDFFVSVHHNSIELTSDANETTGTETYYFYNQYAGFAKQLNDNISAAGGRLNRSEKYGYFYVTRTTIAPSVLLEVGFMVNPLEYEAVTNDEVIAKTGEALARSVYETVAGVSG